MPRLLTLALAAVAALLPATAPFAAPVLSSFNAFVFRDFVSQASDSEGALVVGGNASLSFYSVNSRSAGVGLVAGGDVALSHGQVNGDLYAGGEAVLSSANATGIVAPGDPDTGYLAAWQAHYEALSAQLGAAATTGSVSRTPWGAVHFDGAGGGTQYFSLTGGLLQGANQWVFSGLSAGQRVVLNIGGSQASLGDLDLSASLEAYDVLLHFPDATEVAFQNTSPHADVLAPRAVLRGSNGHLQGTLVAGGWNSALELHRGGTSYLAPPVAPQVAVSEPGTAALAGLALLAAGAVRRPRRLRGARRPPAAR